MIEYIRQVGLFEADCSQNLVGNKIGIHLQETNKTYSGDLYSLKGYKLFL